MMSRLICVSGILAAFMGAASLLPAVARWLEHEGFGPQGYTVIVIGLLLICSGAITTAWGFRAARFDAIPPPVRAAIAGNGLIVSFCALELSDGLIRQGGRVFYWTSFLFLPALVLFYGQLLGKRWAWWI